MEADGNSNKNWENGQRIIVNTNVSQHIFMMKNSSNIASTRQMKRNGQCTTDMGHIYNLKMRQITMSSITELELQYK